MTQTPYIGSKISLISMLDIRYEGILFTVNSQESTIALSKVRSFGTEERPTLHPVPARDEVYEFIIFKASDIKDLVVCEPPKPSSGPAYDPAIISVSTTQPEDSRRNDTVESSKGRVLAHCQSSSQPPNINVSNNQGGFGRSRRVNGDGNNNAGSIHQRFKDNQNDTHYNRKTEFSGNNDYRHKTRSRVPHNSNSSSGGPISQLRDRPKFDSDFDFEKAYEKFKEQLESVTSDLMKVNVEGEENAENFTRSAASSPVNDETFYNKKTSFFDNISCEALEKTEGKATRPDWKKERITNQETFGHSAVRSLAYRRGQRNYVSVGNSQNRQPQNNNNFQRRNFQSMQQQRHRYNNNQGQDNNQGSRHQHHRPHNIYHGKRQHQSRTD